MSDDVVKQTEEETKSNKRMLIVMMVGIPIVIGAFAIFDMYMKGIPANASANAFVPAARDGNKDIVVFVDTRVARKRSLGSCTSARASSAEFGAQRGPPNRLAIVQPSVMPMSQARCASARASSVLPR